MFERPRALASSREVGNAPGVDRTRDPLFRRQLLYPLSYGGWHSTGWVGEPEA
jgi:hypothetical protein